MSGADLAEFHGVSESYLQKHLQAAVRAGLLTAMPGPQGGFRLARSAASISLLDIVHAIDGPGPAFRCTEIRQRTPAAPGLPRSAFVRRCVIHAAMASAEAAWRAELAGQSIAQIATRVSEVHARSVGANRPWVEAHTRG
jgi:Rrf2 family protein